MFWIFNVFLHILIWCIAAGVDSIFVWNEGYDGFIDDYWIWVGFFYLWFSIFGLLFSFLDLFLLTKLKPERRNQYLSRILGIELTSLTLLVLGYHINNQHLPFILDPISILFNIALIIISTLFSYIFQSFINWLYRLKKDFVLTLLVIILILVTGWLQTRVIRQYNQDSNVRAIFGPNIVLITLDTLRFDHLGKHGYPDDVSPNLDLFAEENVFLTNIRTPMPLTSPSHASLFTGALPSTHNVLTNISSFHSSRDFPPITNTIASGAEVTAGFPSAVHMSKEFNFDHGWSIYNQNSVTTGPEWLQGCYQWAPVAVLLRLHIFRETNLARLSYEVNKAFYYFLNQYDSDRPFLVWLHYFDVHSPYQPPEEYWQLFDPDYNGDITGSQEELDLINAQIEQTNYGETLPDGFTQDDIDNLIARYDGEIRRMDESIGELFDNLKQNGLWGDTVIIIVSDHGEGLYDDGYFGHNYTLKEYEIRLACLIKGPDIICDPDTPLSITDLTDYIKYVSGLDPDPENCRFTATNFAGDDQDPQTSMVFLKSQSWLEYPYKLIRTHTGEGRGVEYELYNLDDDPGESVNLFDPNDEISYRLRDNLNIWLDENNADFSDLLQNQGTIENLEPETLEMLRSLGYIY